MHPQFPGSITFKKVNSDARNINNGTIFLQYLAHYSYIEHFLIFWLNHVNVGRVSSTEHYGDLEVFFLGFFLEAGHAEVITRW